MGSTTKNRLADMLDRPSPDQSRRGLAHTIPIADPLRQTNNDPPHLGPTPGTLTCSGHASASTTPADVKGLQWHVCHEGAGTSRSVTHDPGRGYFLSEGLVALAPADWGARCK